MSQLTAIEIIGFWCGIFLTFCILSFLYKDNPFYKFAEHLFVGVSIGYIVITQFQNNVVPRFTDDNSTWLTFVPIGLAALMFVKFLSPRLAWMGRFPLAFVVAMAAGQNVAALVQSDIAEQVKTASRPLDLRKVDLNTASADTLISVAGVTPGIATKLIAEREQRPFTSVEDAVTRPSLSEVERAGLADERGHLVGIDANAAVTGGQLNVFGTLSQILLLVAFLTALLYFYFSVAHKGTIGKVSRFGVWIIMIGFGASFGFTVQGRIALAIGRAQDIRGKFMEPSQAAQVHGELAALVSVAIIVVGIVAWERYNKRRANAAGNTGGTPSGTVN
ncbi:MAG TPA: helix-hairpin-helix domain-containing protein [Kofleriaceae bacterium]|nr:helix-hairpin-helix domain-containing protein [Kofleriaceae bacterium]